MPVAILLLGLTPFAAGQALPELGDSSSDLLPPYLERRIGEQAYQDIRSRDPRFLDEPALVQYIDDLGRRLVSSGSAAGQHFEFFLINDNTVNAFAMPGGYIGVHTGLVLAAQSESELASVLAHEIAHVTQHHIARMVSRERQVSTASMAAMLVALLAARSRPDLASAAAVSASAGSIQAQLNYSREFEREADRIGLQMMLEAGFDANGMALFFARLQKSASLVENGAPAYLRTHPLTTERIADMQNRSHNAPYRQVTDSIDFHLTKAALRSMQGTPRDAVALAERQLKERRFASEPGARFALAAALERAGLFERAEKEVSRSFLGGATPHPMVNLLAAKIQTSRGRPGAARDLLRAASALHPAYRPLTYALIDSYQRLGQHPEALRELTEAIANSPRDARLYEMRAKSYAATGRRLLQHQALAEHYYLIGSLPEAVEQLQFARDSGDGDFYQMSVVEARLRQFRAELSQSARPGK
ncbi:MAG: M48 family metallopeptidase [Burkholderiales bacterium]|nr:M48 family metallopeptidase [Burkholderiales bacterium]